MNHGATATLQLSIQMVLELTLLLIPNLVNRIKRSQKQTTSIIINIFRLNKSTHWWHEKNSHLTDAT
jgi:hypothetical protein